MNLALIFGGQSVEHDISIITALQTMSGLDNKYNLIPIYITPQCKMVTADNLTDEKTYLNFAKNVKGLVDVAIPAGKSEILTIKKGKIKKKIKIDCALLCCHGHGGEDGNLQGLLELAQIPYTSCDPFSSALCMDKVATKIFLTNAHIPTPKYVSFDKSSYEANHEKILKEICDEISFPCIIKPANLGSSVGISICENEQEIECSVDEALQFDKKNIVEQYIDNAREFCCAII